MCWVVGVSFELESGEEGLGEGKRDGGKGRGTILVGGCKLRRKSRGLDRWLDSRDQGGLQERRIRVVILVEGEWGR